jgi:DNA-binding IclR family transcriptional regulator
MHRQEQAGSDQDVHRSSRIQSVGRALDLLEVLANEELGLVELGRRTGLQPSTTHRMLATLTDRGYVTRDDDGRYRLASKATSNLGGVLSSRERRLMAAVRPLMQRVHIVTQQTIHLTVLDGTDVVFVYQLLHRDRLGAMIHDNIRLPAHVSASGKALLAFQPGNLAAKLISHELKPSTRETIVNRRVLSRDLERIRDRGYALDYCEYRPDRCCVAAPIFEGSDRPIAAISASGSANAIRPELFADFGELIATSANEASAALGCEGRSGWSSAR